MVHRRAQRKQARGSCRAAGGTGSAGVFYPTFAKNFDDMLIESAVRISHSLNFAAEHSLEVFLVKKHLVSDSFIITARKVSMSKAMNSDLVTAVKLGQSVRIHSVNLNPVILPITRARHYPAV